MRMLNTNVCGKLPQCLIKRKMENEKKRDYFAFGMIKFPERFTEVKPLG